MAPTTTPPTAGRPALRPNAVAIKRRMAAAAAILGVPIPKGYKAAAPWYGAPARDLARALAAKYGLKSGSLITVKLLACVAETLGDAATAGEKALRWLDQHRIYEGATNNRGAELDAWWREYDPDFLAQPWCGLSVWKAYKDGAGIDLRDAGIVYTPAMVASIYARRAVKGADGKRYALTAVAPTAARPGDIVLFDWQQSGFGAAAANADHVGLCRGPAVNGGLPTLEGNTRPGNTGDQSGHGGGDGVYARDRDVSYVLTIATLVPLT